MRFRLPIQKETGCRTCHGVVTICTQDLLNNLVPWPTFTDLLQQPVVPDILRDMLIGPSFHQHHVEGGREMPITVWRIQQTINDATAFIRRQICSKFTDLVRCRRQANQILKLGC